jgi:hypothetical protein
MKFEQTVNKLFTNTYFLYAMVFFSALSILGYLLSNNFNAIVFFALVGVITINFSRNMAVVLSVCLLATNFLLANKIHEGMKSKKTTTTAEEDVVAEEPVLEEEELPVAEDEVSTTESEEKKNKMKKMMMMKKMKESKSASSDTDSTAMIGTDEPFGMRKGQSAKLDHAASIKQAYGDLNNILNPEAIKNLTTETMDLMKEQKKLMASMSSMQPLMNQAQELVQGFKSGGFGK